jgi:HAD superfamily, subfamily IIIB (Acid phosphatase)
LNLESNYANEARSVASQGENWLAARSRVPHRAIVLDVDDTTLTTWNYELYSNWDFNPTTNAQFVGLTGNTFTGNAFPATPGMLDLVDHAHALGYAISGSPDGAMYSTPRRSPTW